MITILKIILLIKINYKLVSNALNMLKTEVTIFISFIIQSKFSNVILNLMPNFTQIRLILF